MLIGVATSSLALHAPSQIVAAIKSRAIEPGASVVVSNGRMFKRRRKP
ncbi:hypothetical protein [Enterobacter hormaechei]